MSKSQGASACRQQHHCCTALVHSLSCVRLFVTPRTAARQASLSSTISQSLLKLTSIESVTPSNHLILCHPLLLLPSIFPSIRVFSNESALPITWPKDWSVSFSISTSMNIKGWFPLGLTGLIPLQSKGLSRVFSSTIQKHQFFGVQPSLWTNSHIHTWRLEKSYIKRSCFCPYWEKCYLSLRLSLKLLCERWDISPCCSGISWGGCWDA